MMMMTMMMVVVVVVPSKYALDRLRWNSWRPSPP
jgi:hypothetical protein